MTQQPPSRRPWAGAETNGKALPAWARFRTLEIGLRPWWRSGVFFLAAFAVALCLGGEALRAAYIAMLGDSQDAAKLEKAVALDPGDPELHHRLGMILCESFGDTARREGLRQLRRATALNPNAARYWSDLAWVCELSADPACSEQSVEQAIKISPMTPQLHWVAANTFLRAGENDKALAQFRRLLELDHLRPRTFHVCVGSLGDPQLVLARFYRRERTPATISLP